MTLRVDTVRRLREEVAGLVARIRHDEGEGLDEQIGEAERRREELTGEQAALQRDAVVLTLLRDMLAEAGREARERYVAPVLRRVTPYLQGLFPGVEVSLGDQLRVATLTRQAGTEDLERLSIGTAEQVAVLLRLAYADLLIDAGKPAMLILDDVSTPAVFWPNVGVENSPLCFGLIASVSPGRLDGSEVAEVEFNDCLERFCR